MEPLTARSCVRFTDLLSDPGSRHDRAPSRTTVAFGRSDRGQPGTGRRGSVRHPPAADLGARVIKIERPDGGDFARRYDETVHGQSSYFVWLNRSKESLTLDVKTTDGRAVLEQLLTGADVLVHNLGPGAAARIGIDATSLAD